MTDQTRCESRLSEALASLKKQIADIEAMQEAEQEGDMPTLTAVVLDISEARAIVQSETASNEPPPGYRTGRRKLVYNKLTKQIDVVDTASGFVVDSFDPPEGA